MKYFILLLSFFNLAYSSEIKVCVGEKLSTIDPHRAMTVVDKEVHQMLIYETVVKYEFSENSLVPFLISRFSSDSSHRAYTLFFKKDIKFNEKYDLTVDDYLFSLELYKEKVSKGFVVDDYFKMNVKDFKKASSNSMIITLVKSDPFFMKRLAEAMGVVLSKKYYDDLKAMNKLASFYQNPVGSGAYALTLMKNNETTLQKKKFYHFGNPKVEQYKFITIKDKKDRLKHLRSLLCDIAFDVEGDSQDKDLRFFTNKAEDFLFLKIRENTNASNFLSNKPLNYILSLDNLKEAVKDVTRLKGNIISNNDFYLMPKKAEREGEKPKVITLYLEEEAQKNIHFLKKFFDVLKKGFDKEGISLRLIKDNDADIIISSMALNGFPEKNYFLFFNEWNSEANFSKDFFSNLKKPYLIYPIGFKDKTFGVNNKIKDFYSFRSDSPDLTAVTLSLEAKK